MPDPRPHGLDDDEYYLVEDIRALARDLETWLGVKARAAAERRLGVEAGAPVDGDGPYQVALTVVEKTTRALKQARELVESGIAVAEAAPERGRNEE